MAQINFQTLGPVSMYVGPQAADLGSPKQQFLLAVLLAEAGSPVRTAQLVERVWESRPPSTVRNALSTYATQLRALLAPFRLRLLRGVDRYTLDVPPAMVDMHRFRGLLDDAQRERDDRRALLLLTEALALYRGNPFDGLRSQWADTVREDLAARRRAAFLDRNMILLRHGRHGEVLAELTSAAAAAPLDEAIAEQLIVALQYSGQRAAAVRHFHHVRRTLDEELRVSPGNRLQCLYQRLLANQPVPALV